MKKHIKNTILCFAFITIITSLQGQRIDIGYRFGTNQSLLILDYSLNRIFQPYADFYNSSVILNTVEVSPNFLDIISGFVTTTYYFKDETFIRASVGFNRMSLIATLTFDTDIFFPDGFDSGELVAFDINNTSIGFDIGARLLRSGRLKPFLYSGLTYTRNWRLKESPLERNIFYNGLETFRSFSANILSVNAGLNLNVFEIVFSLEYRRNITPIDINKENVLFKSLSSFINTVTIPLILIDPTSKKNKKVLERINRSF